MSIPPAGPQPPMQPLQPSGEGQPITPLSSPQDAFLLSSPFAKMFERTGAKPTAQEIRGIINGILKQEIENIKKDDARWKEAMRKLKEIIEDKEG